MKEPSLINNFTFKNLQSGHYIFYIDIFEIDGSTSHYEYKIIIKKFLWQQWWFWLAIALLCIAVVAYLLNLKKEKQLAEQAAKTKEAELQTVKAEQAKKIANLQLVTLSSQFRPHFILNALNTIGAQMDDKPEAESVLSRLGESINLIFSHAQQQKIVHPFANEWQLVENIIHIHRLMYLKQLQTDVPTNDVLKKYSDIKVPLGILQIPIENALLHGLSNKEHEPWLLAIKIQENNDYIFIEINDNGVGRKKSATLSNFTKHGTGTKNLTEIINIINASNPHKIMVEYKDDAFTENNIGVGTTVTITLPKLLDYANE
jgi:LytS/YehU family sensor histidine kinase